MNCSMPGFPVLHYLPEFAQTHINVNLKGRVTETKQGDPRELCLQHIKEKKKNRRWGRGDGKRCKSFSPGFSEQSLPAINNTENCARK